MEPVLSVRNLVSRLKIGNKIYPVVNQLSFDLHKGKTLALVGESGSGKTMTALSIMRILPEPPALSSLGQIYYKNIDILSISEKKMRELRGSKIAMIFQDPMTALNPVYTIGYQLREVAAYHLKLYDEAAYQLCTKCLEDVGLTATDQIMDSYPHQISGGMKQRAMIAMSLICSPDILIADEPTTALDVTVQAQILQLLKELQAKKGMSILLITHDMGVVAEMADDVIVMYATKNIEQGRVLDIFDKRAHPYTQGLFRCRSDIPLKKAKLEVIKGNVPAINALPSGCHFHPRCPYVMPICKNGEVPDFPLPEENHFAKCWLHDPKIKEERNSDTLVRS